MTEDRREQAWTVYRECQAVFRDVLRVTAPWDPDGGVDLIHDFVLDRLPRALVSYDPNRGPLEPWLYQVFLNYTRRRRAQCASTEQRWVSLESVAELTAPPADAEGAPAADAAVAQVVQRLPDEVRALLLAYFSNGPGAGSIRGLAQRFNLSKYGAKQALLAAVDAVAQHLQGVGILSGDEMQVCRARLGNGEPWEAVAAAIHKTEDEAKALLRSAVTTLGRSLARVAPPQVAPKKE